MSDKITELTGVEARYTVLGHTQRGGCPTSYDRILATKFGAYAAKLAVDGMYLAVTEKRQCLPAIGDYGKMVSLRGMNIETVQITPSLEEQKMVNPADDQMVWAARMVGTIFGDERLDQITPY